MKPATPQTEPPSSTQLRKAVFGGSLNRLSASLGLFAVTLVGINAMAALIAPVPEKIPCTVADRQDFQDPDRVQDFPPVVAIDLLGQLQDALSDLLVRVKHPHAGSGGFPAAGRADAFLSR